MIYYIFEIRVTREGHNIFDPFIKRLKFENPLLYDSVLERSNYDRDFIKTYATWHLFEPPLKFTPDPGDIIQVKYTEKRKKGERNWLTWRVGIENP